MITSKDQEYEVSGTRHIGTMCWDDSGDTPRPGVIVFHAFGGKSEFEVNVARRLAGLGYCGFAADIYGNGMRAGSRDEAFELMNQLDGDRGELLQRLQGGFQAMAAHPLVDTDRMSAIGFCFGGKCALDLARSGADIRSAISFHGLYDPPSWAGDDEISASLLILHGWKDPLAMPDQLIALGNELNARNADWQVQVFGTAGHAFTHPNAADREGGLFYDPTADHRAWATAEALLEETLVLPKGPE
jgi:dienelactone hydrolase